MTAREQKAGTPLDAGTLAELRALSDSGLDPSRDLWRDLAPELRREMMITRARRRRWIGLVASVTLTLSVLAGWLLQQQGAAPAMDLTVAVGQSSLPAGSSSSLVEERERYLAQREVLLAIVARDLAHYPQEVRDDVWRGLDTLGRAIVRLEQSLEPSATDDEARLTRLYELELDMLTTVRSRLRGSASVANGDRRG